MGSKETDLCLVPEDQRAAEDNFGQALLDRRSSEHPLAHRIGVDCPYPIDFSEARSELVSTIVEGTNQKYLDALNNSNFMSKKLRFLAFAGELLPNAIDYLEKQIVDEVKLDKFARAIIYFLADIIGYNPLLLKIAVPDEEDASTELALHFAKHIYRYKVKHHPTYEKAYIAYLGIYLKK